MQPITLPMAELKPALSGLSKLIRKSGLPVLKTIKVERTADGWIALTATDLDAFTTVRLEQPAQGEPFTILVPYEELTRTVKTCAKNDNILVAPGANNTGFIQYGLGTQLAEIEFESLPVTEFPETPRINGDAFPIPAALRTSIHEALECCSTDPTRAILNGVCIDVSKSGAHYVVGTDGRHLFSSNSFNLPLKTSLIIPSHKFLEWSVFNGDGEWQMKVGAAAKNERARFQIASRRWRFISNPHEGNYPNWRQVIPDAGESKTVIEMNPQTLDALLQTIQRIPCHDVVNNTIGIAITDAKLHILGKSTGSTDWTRVPIEGAKCTGKDTTVFLNRELLSKALGFGLARMDIIDATSPLRLSDGGRQMIIMPIRTESATAKPAPAPAAEQTNPPPQPAEQPKEDKTTMPENNNTNASRIPETKETKPSLDTALAQLEVVRGDFRNAIAGLNKLGELLRQSQRETKASGKEIESVRQTLRSLQSVRI